jgi:hypothetical protein
VVFARGCTAGVSGREAHLVGTLQLPAEDAAVGGVDAERLADELGEVGGGLAAVHGVAVVHGGAVCRSGASSRSAARQPLQTVRQETRGKTQETRGKTQETRGKTT